MSYRKALIIFSLTALIFAYLAGSFGDAGVVAQEVSNDSYRYGAAGLTAAEIRGRDTWYWWTGGDGDQGGQGLWRKIAVLTHGDIDLLQVIDSRLRDDRFVRWGVINDPDCKSTASADRWGLWIDDCSEDLIPNIPGEPTGIIGLRWFQNPKFDPQKWDLAVYKADPAKIEPPYIVGMACGFCHVGLNPNKPPADPAHPHWSELHPGIGNQYFREGLFFTYTLKSRPQAADFRWQVAFHQPPGTSDTSRVATDHINNPNAINVIVNLNQRPKHAEQMADGSTRDVYHILKDGADSVGSLCLAQPEQPNVNDTACAGLRVYVNIGICSDYWTQLHDPIFGVRADQKIFDIAHVRQDCKAWQDTAARTGDLEAFLRTIKPLKLADAPGGSAFISTDAELLEKGKKVFVKACASCHSSKRVPSAENIPADFFADNFLSDDERHSVVEIGTNISRAVASNAIRGHIWEQFSSETYKSLPCAGRLNGLFNPVRPGKPLSFDVPCEGRGYYRTPTLLQIWATAPFFHNNALGNFTGDSSVAGRVAAYEDAMRKLLWPEQRLGAQSMPVTTRDNKVFQPGGATIDVPAGMPINLLARLQPPDLDSLNHPSLLSRIFSFLIRKRTLDELLLKRSLAPDFIEDRGHIFGSELSDQDKRALIEFVKTL
jgi:hypothetical protein